MYLNKLLQPFSLKIHFHVFHIPDTWTATLSLKNTHIIYFFTFALQLPASETFSPIPQFFCCSKSNSLNITLFKDSTFKKLLHKIPQLTRKKLSLCY